MKVIRRTVLAFLLLAFSITAISCSKAASKEQQTSDGNANKQAESPAVNYPWLTTYDPSESIASRIPVPETYERIETAAGSFECWLRHLPLEDGRSQVHLYDGSTKRNQNSHFAVVNIDVGNKDLQQCADAVIRLRAEYLYSLGRFDAIHFNFTSGDRADFTAWIGGSRPIVLGNNVRWVKLWKKDYSHKSFRAYMNAVFRYAGSASLSKELHPVADVNDMQIGDVFIRGGFPGHAAIVVDMAPNRQTGKKVFLLAQSYMPAQDIHVLRNPTNRVLDPWYQVDFGEILRTPDWVFTKNELMRF
jgi:hypothetical protein